MQIGVVRERGGDQVVELAIVERVPPCARRGRRGVDAGGRRAHEGRRVRRGGRAAIVGADRAAGEQARGRAQRERGAAGQGQGFHRVRRFSGRRTSAAPARRFSSSASGTQASSASAQQVKGFGIGHHDGLDLDLLGQLSERAHV